jgi:hypothetical protein
VLPEGSRPARNREHPHEPREGADHGERCRGHVSGGVRGIYDLLEHRDENAKAAGGLPALAERIVNPPADDAPAIASRYLISDPVNFRQPVASS